MLYINSTNVAADDTFANKLENLLAMSVEEFWWNMLSIFFSIFLFELCMSYCLHTILLEEFC